MEGTFVIQIIIRSHWTSQSSTITYSKTLLNSGSGSLDKNTGIWTAGDSGDWFINILFCRQLFHRFFFSSQNALQVCSFFQKSFSKNLLPPNFCSLLNNVESTSSLKILAVHHHWYHHYHNHHQHYQHYQHASCSVVTVSELFEQNENDNDDLFSNP